MTTLEKLMLPELSGHQLRAQISTMREIDIKGEEQRARLTKRRGGEKEFRAKFEEHFDIPMWRSKPYVSQRCESKKGATSAAKKAAKRDIFQWQFEAGNRPAGELHVLEGATNLEVVTQEGRKEIFQMPREATFGDLRASIRERWAIEMDSVKMFSRAKKMNDEEKIPDEADQMVRLIRPGIMKGGAEDGPEERRKDSEKIKSAKANVRMVLLRNRMAMPTIAYVLDKMVETAKRKFEKQANLLKDPSKFSEAEKDLAKWGAELAVGYAPARTRRPRSSAPKDDEGWSEIKQPAKARSKSWPRKQGEEEEDDSTTEIQPAVLNAPTLTEPPTGGEKGVYLVKNAAEALSIMKTLLAWQAETDDAYSCFNEPLHVAIPNGCVSTDLKAWAKD